MFEEMRARGLAEPLYDVSRGTVRVALNSLVADGQVLGQFSPEYLRIVDVVRRGQRVSTGEVAEAAGIARPTAIIRLKQLQQLGAIDWVGKSPSDPRAYWRLRSE